MMRRTKRMTIALVPMVLVLGVASLVVAPPASAYVVGFQAVWLHGTGVRVEYPERLSQILYRAYHARI